MKCTKRLFVFFLSFILIFAFCFAASAAEEKAYGLDVNITSEKEEYDAGETIPLVIELTNNNAFPLTNINIESVLPEGFVFATTGNNSMRINILPAMETRRVHVDVLSSEVLELAAAQESGTESCEIRPSSDSDEEAAESITEPSSGSDAEAAESVTEPSSGSDAQATESVTQPLSSSDADTKASKPVVNNAASPSNGGLKSPKTSDSSNLIFYVLILIAASVFLWILLKHRKRAKRLLALILCLLLTAMSVNYLYVFAAETQDISIAFCKDLTISEEQFKAEFLITMDQPSQEDADIDSEEETDPDLLDSDSDGLTDYEETVLGLDPYNPMSDGETLDAERLFNQQLSETCISNSLLTDENIIPPSLKGNVPGIIDRHVYLEYENNYVLKECNFIIGLPVRVETDYTGFDITLSFDYSELLAQYENLSSDDLFIYELCDGNISASETVNNQELSTVEVSASSNGVYFVVNKPRLLGHLGVNSSISDSEETQYDETQKAPVSSGAGGNIIPVDIVFVIDSTASMSMPIHNLAKNVKSFADNLSSHNVNANFGLVQYKDITVEGPESTKVASNYYDDWFWSSMPSELDSFRDAIENIYADGGGDEPESAIDALETARNIGYMRRNVNKFFILITDASFKTGTRSGEISMSKMIEELKKDGITTLVITTESKKSLYTDLYSYKLNSKNQNGTYANIYADFDVTLSNFADTITEEVDPGSWALLGNLKYVKLSSLNWETNGNDTDGDGRTDKQELGTASYTSTGQKIYSAYVSDPTLIDTDFDGRNDNIDAAPKNNEFKTKFTTDFTKSGYTPPDTTYKMDYRWFFESNEIYNKDLSKTSILYASDIYVGTRMQIDGVKYTIDTLMQYHGMDKVTRYDLSKTYSDYHLSEMVVGHRKVEYNGQAKDIIAVSVRGTNGTLAEWSSNFDVGTPKYDSTFTDSKFAKYACGSADWADKENHKGFDIASTRLFKNLTSYLTSNSYSKSNTVIWITGHSRGAAIANIMGARLKDNGYKSFAYTFATPNTTTKSATTVKNNYKHIFNILNAEDFVPRVPMSQWNFTKYGRNATDSIDTSNYKQEWDNLTGITAVVGNGYNPIDLSALNTTVQKLSTIASNSPTHRDNCYWYTCKHKTAVKDTDNKNHSGDGTNTNVTSNYFFSATLDKLTTKTPNAKPYCSIILVPGWISPLDTWDVCQMPAFYMQVLSAFMAEQINTYEFAAGDAGTVGTIGIANRYADAHYAMIQAGIRGITHAHYTESYVILSKYIEEAKFN